MSFFRIERGIVTHNTEPAAIGDCPIRERRRRRGLARSPVARAGAPTPRIKKTVLGRPPPPYAPELLGVHDFGDGRHAVEFNGPSLDMMLYHDRGVTLAEWVTVDGELLSLIVVGDC